MGRLLTIGVLFAVWLPIYGQKESPKAGTNQQYRDETSNPTHPPPPKIKCVVKQDGTTIECDYPQANPPTYFTRLRSAENLPNLLLVVVGIFGIGTAICTLKKLETQTGATVMAAKATVDSVGAIKKQADLIQSQIDLTIEKERAKIGIEFDSLSPDPSEPEGGCYVVTGYVSIYGCSEAFIGNTEITASIGASGLENPLPEWRWGMHLGAVIRPNATDIPFKTFIMGRDACATDEEMILIRNGKAFVYCAIKIEFTTLGQDWVLRARRKFRPVYEVHGAEWVEFLGEWEINGMDWENGESRKHKDENPN